MTVTETDVLVVGTGPGGAAASLLLAREGVRVVAVDAARFPRDKVCSEFMSPAVLPIFERLGVLQRLRSEGERPLGTTVYAPRGGQLTGRFAPWGPAQGLALPRRTLDALLVSAARDSGVRLLEGSRVRDLVYERGAVAGAVIAGPDGMRIIRSRLVVGADGLRSLVARRLGTRTHAFPRRLAFVAHVRDVRGVGASAELHVGRAGYVGINPIGCGVSNVALIVPRRRAAAARGDAAGFFHQALETFSGVAGRVVADRVVREVLVTGPFAARSSRVIAPGALLLGDAAEFFDPFTGEGIYRALRGAELAAAVAAPALRSNGVVGEEGLRPYLVARRTAFAGHQLVERMIGWLMYAPALFDRAVRQLERHGLADRLIGVTGDLLPARAALNPGFLLRTLI